MDSDRIAHRRHLLYRDRPKLSTILDFPFRRTASLDPISSIEIDEIWSFPLPTDRSRPFPCEAMRALSSANPFKFAGPVARARLEFDIAGIRLTSQESLDRDASLAPVASNRPTAGHLSGIILITGCPQSIIRASAASPAREGGPHDAHPINLATVPPIGAKGELGPDSSQTSSLELSAFTTQTYVSTALAPRIGNHSPVFSPAPAPAPWPLLSPASLR